MKELVEVIAKALVDHPEEVQVEEERKDDVVFLPCMSRHPIWAR